MSGEISLDAFLADDNHVYLLANDQIFKEKFALRIAEGEVKNSSGEKRANVPCVLSKCNEILMTIEKFVLYVKIAHPVLPIIFSILLTSPN